MFRTPHVLRGQKRVFHAAQCLGVLKACSTHTASGRPVPLLMWRHNQSGIPMKLTPWEPDLKTVVDRIDSGDIDLQPDFQRQEIWSPAKKRRLIDTIMRGWSIPPVFLVVTKDGRMEVLDGQQRLAAVRDFFHNEFSIDGKITPADQRIESLDGRYYRRLDAVDKRLIDQYTLRCFRITDYLPDEPSELFYRLNQPSMLTAGEQRNAFYGPAREQLKTLVQTFEAAVR
jgi:hypothetical protein